MKKIYGCNTSPVSFQIFLESKLPAEDIITLGPEKQKGARAIIALAPSIDVLKANEDFVNNFKGIVVLFDSLVNLASVKHIKYFYAYKNEAISQAITETMAMTPILQSLFQISPDCKNFFNMVLDDLKTFSTKNICLEFTTKDTLNQYIAQKSKGRLNIAINNLVYSAPENERDDLLAMIIRYIVNNLREEDFKKYVLNIFKNESHRAKTLDELISLKKSGYVSQVNKALSERKNHKEMSQLYKVDYMDLKIVGMYRRLLKDS